MLSERIIEAGLVLQPTAALTATVRFGRSARFDGFATIDQDTISLELGAEL